MNNANTNNNSNNKDDNYQVGLLKAINSKLEKNEKMFRNLCDISGYAYIYIDFEDNIFRILGDWSHFFDIDSDKFNGLNALVELAENEYADKLYKVLNIEKYGLKNDSVEFKLNDSKMIIEAVSYVSYDENRKPLWKAILFRDFTKFRNQNEELSYMAYYDNVTGLYNRNYFVLSLTEFVNKAKENNSIVSVLFIDVDDFRKINDGLGILEGDDVVQQIGSYLNDLTSDKNIIASHFNSDVFCMAIYDPIGRRSVKNIVEDIRNHMKEPIKVVNQNGRMIEVTLTVSIGVAEYPESTQKALELINLAEIVMLKAKNKGKNNVQFYDKPIIEEFISNIELEKKLSLAIKKQQFFMYYQPQYDVQTGNIRGVEALVRWRETDGNVISPETFIPIAEKNGSILLLGDWIIEECISNFSTLSKRFELKDFVMSINVSSLQFKSKNFVNNLISVIKRYNVSPTCIELEITESVFIDNIDEIVKKMKMLKDFGIRFSMDDFGTGFSSLSYLRELPIDTLKIDKSFIDDVVTDGSTRTIAESIISMSKKLGFDTIAEGVEQEVQYSLLKNIGCENIQGFYLGKPQQLDDIFLLLEKQYS